MSDHKKTAIRRESASLIIAARCSEPNKSNCDYNVLLLKRSDKTAMATNQAVFPGGLFEAADESTNWINYFREIGIAEDYLKKLIISENRPNILAPQGNGCYDRFFKKTFIWAREVSLRLTAIRETFEEVGILLCRSKSNLYADLEYVCCNEDFDRAHWQVAVHNDSSEFLNLCKFLNVVPDLWSLHEWSAWASPSPIRKGFETVFFIVILNKTPSVLAEETEVKECMWKNPKEIARLYQNGDLWFLPPQVYELSRLFLIDSIDVLNTFSKQRASKGITMFLPVGYICTDGMVSVLPGDDFYLDPHTQNSFILNDFSMVEFRQKAKLLHRIENVGYPNSVIQLNFEPLNGHLRPIHTMDERNKL